MKVAIMQPYFLPYIGYFQLINRVETFILIDEVQYIRHGWINRNRILKPIDGWQYIIIPLSGVKRNDKILDIQIEKNPDARLKILRQLDHYKKIARNYHFIRQLVQESILFETQNIADLNFHLLKNLCRFLGIETKIIRSSSLNLNYEKVNGPGDWALEISKQIGAKTYVNPIGGREIFDKDKFQKAGIELAFLDAQITEYSQGRNSFEGGLSIVDVMMFNTIDWIKYQIALGNLIV